MGEENKKKINKFIKKFKLVSALVNLYELSRITFLKDEKVHIN